MQNSMTVDVSTPERASHHEVHATKANKLRVWAISEYYQPNFSGAAIQAHRILSRLVQHGHEVHVLTVADQAARELAGKRSRIDGIIVDYLPVLRRFSWQRLPVARTIVCSINELLRRATFDLRIAWTLLRHARRGDIVQFYVVGELTRLVIWLAARRGMRSLIQISLCGADDPLSIQAGFLGISASMTRSCFFAVDRVIGLSSALTNSCRQFGLSEESIVRIPNGVDLDSFRRSADLDRDGLCQRLGLNPLQRHIVFVGSAIHRKGIDVAIRSFIDFAKQRRDVDLVIVGPADFSDRTRHAAERQELIERMRGQLTDNDLSNRVHWIGEVSEVHDFLLAADVFLFPTRREGLPNAVAEAMAAELPVVASRIEGVTTDLVQHGRHGILIDGYDSKPYTNALCELFQNEHKRRAMAHASRQRMEREFELSRIAARYEDLYNSLVTC